MNVPSIDNSSPEADQLAAAKHHSEIAWNVFENLVVSEVPKAEKAGPGYEVFRDLLDRAVDRRVRKTCRHVQSGWVAMFIELSSGWAACWDCYPRFVATEPRINDSTCDLCDRYAVIFKEIVVEGDRALLHANICRRCKVLGGFGQTDE
jgi:hypothetical protein